MSLHFVFQVVIRGREATSNRLRPVLGIKTDIPFFSLKRMETLANYIEDDIQALDDHSPISFESRSGQN